MRNSSPITERANVLNFTIFNLGRLQWLIRREIYKVKSPKVIVVEVDDAPYPFGHELFKDVASTEAILSRPYLCGLSIKSPPNMTEHPH